ncbi:hypothetical protein KO02_12255 [Sphingobacterium sp. ML3W]|uniref:hypothetical protein n=1 Tax=Sphingobacterium sp. ML3W TaxID=1538644 RepID=UPI0004F8EF37|nr:hypothetical protein [Sphingobacterium sp. ML3W]AIM37377.1 hypothetical protein KO02_12255 [Sphingobacterium sp. ML3W]
MIKGEIIGQVLLRMSGGRPNTDMSVRYNDVAVLIAPCVNYLYTKQYYLEKSQEDGNKDVNPLMLQTYEMKVLYDAKRNRKYSNLPAKPITLPSGRSIDFIGSYQGKGYIPISSQDLDLEEYYACFKKSLTSYYLEGSKIWYYNSPPLVDDAIVKMIVSADNLGDDDEVNVPTGTEPELLQMLFEMMTGQRELPSDPINDGQEK